MESFWGVAGFGVNFGVVWYFFGTRFCFFCRSVRLCWFLGGGRGREKVVGSYVL